METNINGFITLREQILEQAIPLLETADISPEDKFRLSIQVAQAKGSVDLYHKAFQAAQGVAEGGERLQAYLELLDDIDFVISDRVDTAAPIEEVSQESQTTPAAVSVPVSQESPEPIAQ